MLEIQNVSVDFWLSRRTQLSALRQVSLQIHSGEILGVVGESGCGKSTLARVIMQLQAATEGALLWCEKPIAQWPERQFRQQIQMIFQDPLDVLNPRMTVAEIIAEPLQHLRPELDQAAILQRVDAVLQLTGLSAGHLNRYPHEFSGGQCQRIGIARALAPEPRLIVCDEPVSALDVSIQAQIINLLADLRDQQGLSLLFISHDLSVVHCLSDRILVLYGGQMMELAPATVLEKQALHPYTQLLHAAVPLADPVKEKQRLAALAARPASSERDSNTAIRGCVFQSRCPQAAQVCHLRQPNFRQYDNGHFVACHAV